MPELIVTVRELRYAGNSLVRGERFTASEKDAKVLKLIRKAEDAPSAAPLRKVADVRPVERTPEPAPEDTDVEAFLETASLTPADPQPETEAAPAPKPKATPKRGKYSTRRLKAKD